MYTHLPLSVCNYATPANKALLDTFDLQIKHYYAKDY